MAKGFAKVVTTKNNKKFLLLSPDRKAGMYAQELKNKRKYNPQKNDFFGAELTDTQKAFRSGYLQARRDSADAYRYNQAKRDGTLDSWKAKKKAREAARRKPSRTNKNS